MKTISEDVFRVLRIAKEMADGEYSESFLKECGDSEVDSGDSGEVVRAGISSIFSDVYEDYNHRIETEITVLFDPLIDELCRLCALYEMKEGIVSERSGRRMQMETAITDSFNFENYVYDYGLRTCFKGPGRKRLVILIGMEFCGYDELPTVLAEVRRTMEDQVRRFRVELGIEENQTMEQEAA